MSEPLDQQRQPPSSVVIQQAYTTPTDSVGPVIGVLAVITILGVIAVMIGRICSGHRIWGHKQYDCEGWIERKFSTCLDGRVDPPPPTRLVDIPIAGPAEGGSQEIMEEEPEPAQDNEDASTSE